MTVHNILLFLHIAAAIIIIGGLVFMDMVVPGMVRAGREYLPVIYPGFGWTNLMGEAQARDNIPRLGGEFFWRQFHAAAELEIDMAYVAMFDEVDEGTAIFKVTNQPPGPGRFLTLDGLSSDWYLRLAGEGSRLIRGELPLQRAMPIQP